MKKDFNMKKLINILLIISIFSICGISTSIAAPNIYYVSTTGNNNNPGTITLPWRTVSYGVSHIVAGDTLYIREGTYQETVYIFVSGSSTQPIIISGYNDENVIIDGNNNTIPSHGSGSYLVTINGGYVTFAHVTVQNSGEHGVGVFGSHSTISHLEIYRNWRRGAGLGGNYEIAEYLNVHQNAMVNYQGATGQDPTALTAGRSPNYAIIRHCKVYENWGIGLSTYESTHSTIEDNISYDNYNNNIYISDATDVLLQRNLVYSTGYMNSYPSTVQTGIALWDEKYTPASARVTIINNFVYGTKHCLRWLSGPLHEGSGMNQFFISNNTFVNSTEESCIYIKDSPIHYDTYIENNIIEQDNSLPVIIVSSNPELHFSNNLWSKTPDVDARDIGDIIGNPMLAHVDNYSNPLWFRLLPSSPAIDHAIVTSKVTDDYWENSRGNSPDIGGHEYGDIQKPTSTNTSTATLTSTPTFTPTITLSQTPNPTNPPRPTKTSRPTNTPHPEHTPRPTHTPKH